LEVNVALKFENKFKIGDKIKSQDFFGKPEFYIAGKITGTDVIRGAKVYLIDIEEDTLDAGREGDVGYVPMEVSFMEWDNRVTLY
jgi:hypothetical protein